MKQSEIRMKMKSVTQKTQQYDRQLSNECKEAIPKSTEQTKTKNSQGRLDSQKHLDALGLKCKIERNRQTTKGWRLQLVKLGPSALKQIRSKSQVSLRKHETQQTLIAHRIGVTVSLKLAPERQWRR